MKFEELLKKTIFPELESGRPNWDKPHTESVVGYVKEIIAINPTLGLDEDVLVVAAYAHDWGYAGLFENGRSLDIEDIHSAKELHMQIGAQKLKKLLEARDFDSLSVGRKERAVHLVRVHDQLDVLKSLDELILMEADTLGGLDIEKVKPSLDSISNQRYMKGVLERRLPLFVTDYGKEKFEKLYKVRESYYRNQLSGFK